MRASKAAEGQHHEPGDIMSNRRGPWMGQRMAEFPVQFCDPTQFSGAFLSQQTFRDRFDPTYFPGATNFRESLCMSQQKFRERL